MTNAEQDQIVLQPGLFQTTCCILAVVAEPPDSILGIVVVPRHPVVLEELKELVLVPDQSHLQGFRSLRSVGLCGKRLEVSGHAPLVSLQVPSLEAVLVDGCNDLTQEGAE